MLRKKLNNEGEGKIMKTEERNRRKRLLKTHIFGYPLPPAAKNYYLEQKRIPNVFKNFNIGNLVMVIMKVRSL